MILVDLGYDPNKYSDKYALDTHFRRFLSMNFYPLIDPGLPSPVSHGSNCHEQKAIQMLQKF